MASPPQKSPPRTPQAPGALWVWWLILLVGLLLGVAGASFAAAPRRWLVGVASSRTSPTSGPQMTPGSASTRPLSCGY
jgi:hypothetical protein